MKFIKLAPQFLILCSATFFTQSSNAYLQLTYNSNPLQFTQGYLNDYPDDTVGSGDPLYPSISLAFDDIAGGAGTHALSNHALVDIADWAYLLEDIPVLNGSITLGENGIPTAWNFSFEITKSTPGYSEGEFTSDDEYKLPSRDKWWFESSHGANTCNCDKYKYEFDNYIERAYYSWAYTSTLGFLFGEENSASNWTLTKADVPEPSSYLLMLLGLIAVGAARKRSRG